jgi:hypothetical protein
MEVQLSYIVWISKLRDDSQAVSFILQSKDLVLQNTQTQE